MLLKKVEDELGVCGSLFTLHPVALKFPFAVPFPFPLPFALRQGHDRSTQHTDTVPVTASRKLGAFSLEVPQQRWLCSRLDWKRLAIPPPCGHLHLGSIWAWWLRRPAGPVLRHVRVPSVHWPTTLSAHNLQALACSRRPAVVVGGPTCRASVL